LLTTQPAGFYIYTFGTIAHVAFCDKLNSKDIAYIADDDSQSWTKFSTILNFSSYLQSIYTLAEVMVLGNWSIVMDAAVQAHSIQTIEDPAARGAVRFSIYLFFILFRGLVVLVVLPILMSFIIQSFIQQLKKQFNRKVVEDEINNNIGGKGGMQIYRIVSNALYSSSMVAIWSSDGRETVTRPLIDQKNQLIIDSLTARKHSLEQDIEKLRLIESNGGSESKDPVFEVSQASLYREEVSWNEMLIVLYPALQNINSPKGQSEMRDARDQSSSFLIRNSSMFYGRWGTWIRPLDSPFQASMSEPSNLDPSSSMTQNPMTFEHTRNMNESSSTTIAVRGSKILSVIPSHIQENILLFLQGADPEVQYH
jgi:hypothetical protein